MLCLAEFSGLRDKNNTDICYGSNLPELPTQCDSGWSSFSGFNVRKFSTAIEKSN